MGWFGKGRKGSVPNELPSLGASQLGSLASGAVASDGRYKPLPKIGASQTSSSASLSRSSLGEVSQKNFVKDDEHGFFREIIRNVTQGDKDFGSMNEWCENSFMPKDMVFQMREYWEKQRPELMLKNVNGELKSRLMEKTEKLHQLEKEWQQAYFNLLAKEEEIRKEEKDLKGSLSEFMNLYKNSLSKKGEQDNSGVAQG